MSIDAMQEMEMALTHGVSVDWLRDMANEHRSWREMKEEIHELIYKQG